MQEGYEYKIDKESGKRIKHVDVIGAIIFKFNPLNKSKSFLLIQRAKDDHWPNHWEFPRGKCDASSKEKLFPCLRREVKEETNLDVIPIKFIDKFSYVADKGKRISTQYNYLCYLKPVKQELKLSKEHQDYMWVSTPGEIELILNSEMKNTFLKVFDQTNLLTNKDNLIDSDVIEENLNFCLESLRV